MSFAIVDMASASLGLPFRRALPATPPEVIAAIREFKAKLAGLPMVEVPTEHVLHAGMYVRTIAMPRGQVLVGGLVKVPTVVTVCGKCAVLAGDEWLELEGFNVIPGSAGRQQVFVSHTAVIISMAFRTAATTVNAAEAEMTDDAEDLLSRKQNANNVVITEE